MTFKQLAPLSIGANLTEKVLVAAVPLIMAALNASALTISVVVTVQAAAWLVASLPAGALTDRMPRARLAAMGAVLSIGGSALAGLALSSVTPHTPWSWGTLSFAAGLFLASSGVVTQALAFFALLPQSVPNQALSKANGAMETIAAGLTLLSPIVIGALLSRGMGGAAFVIAALGGAMALAAARAVAPSEPVSAKHGEATTSMSRALAQSVRDGATFVAHQPILRAIALCAFAWNCAFVALNAYFPVWTVTELGWTVGQAGIAVAGYGAGGLAGAYLATAVIRRFGPGFVFALGPIGSTVGAAIAIVFSPQFGPIAGFAGFMVLGSTAMMWLVLQTTVRQLITPPPYLGRVAATLTTAIYGIRPLGAQLAGLVAAMAAPKAALWLAIGLFALSAAVIALSQAVRLAAMPTQPAA